VVMIIDRETIDLYIEETNQTLADIEKNLLVLEDMGPNVDMPLANLVYNAMHVIKNGASLLSLSKIKELSQKIENVLGLICTSRLTPNPEVINILFQGIDRLYQLIKKIHSDEDMDIDEQTVLLTGLTSAVLPDDIKQSVTEVRDIQVPDAEHGFHIAEFNLIQVLEQGKNIYVLTFDLIKDVQEKNNTPLSFVRFMQEHGEVIDSRFDIKSIGTLEENEISSEMPYFVLFASTLSYDELISLLGVQSYQIKPVHNEIIDLIHSKNNTHKKELDPVISVRYKDTDYKSRKKQLSSLFCELVFIVDCFSCPSDTVNMARMQSVLNSFKDLLNKENNVLAGKILWKVGKNIRDHAYQTNSQAKLDLQCGQIMMDYRILSRLVEPLTTIIIKMIRLVETNAPAHICLKLKKIENVIQITISFANPQIVAKETFLDCSIEEKKLQSLCADLTQSFDLKTGQISIGIPKTLNVLPGLGVKVDNHYYIVPIFNVKYCLTNLARKMWHENNSNISFFHNKQHIQVVGILNTDLSYFQMKKSLIVCEVGRLQFAIATDSTEPLELDAVCQPLSKQLKSNPLIAASCLLEGGEIAFVFEMGFLANKLVDIC